MPYKSVSEAVKKHPSLSKYSEKAKSGWVKAFNSAFKQYGDEAKAFQTAYSISNKIDSKKASIEIAKELLKIARMMSPPGLENHMSLMQPQDNTKEDEEESKVADGCGMIGQRNVAKFY